MGNVLTAGSRVRFQADTEIGLLKGNTVLANFQDMLRQRGLTVESINTTDLDLTLYGARMVRVYAQVITPIERAQETDLMGNMADDLHVASGTDVINQSIQVINLGTPGGTLPAAAGQPSACNWDTMPIGDYLLCQLGIKGATQGAGLALIAGVAVVAILLIKR